MVVRNERTYLSLPLMLPARTLLLGCLTCSSTDDILDSLSSDRYDESTNSVGLNGLNKLQFRLIGRE